ncbi:MAG: NAD(P)H-dependent oxidoreductase [Desulfocucumaceae bacterium]
MNILAINGSPRGEKSNTDCILQPFLEGSRQAGAQTETIYLKNKKINHCAGCFTCWEKTPGVCIHKDDMPGLLEKVRRADVLVFATPLYVFTVSGLMKDFMDRIIPLLKPYIVKRGGQYLHPRRYENEWPKRLVLISNCGFPERSHFSGLVETFKAFTASPDLELSATILCPGGELLRVQSLQEGLQGFFNASRSAGREFVGKGSITPETQAVLDKNLADPEIYSRMANAHWDAAIINKQDPSAAGSYSSAQENLSPALPQPSARGGKPETFLEIITGQAAAFNPLAAGSLRADLQFIVTGRDPGEYVLRIAEGQSSAHRGTVPTPALTIHTPSEVWLQIARGELSGQTAFMQGLYRTEGDLGLLMKMGELFSGKDTPSR